MRARAALLIAGAARAAAWGETEDEPGGPIDHRNFSKHPGTNMHHEPDCVACMENPEDWWLMYRARGLHAGKRWGPGTKSFLELQIPVMKEWWVISGMNKIPPMFKAGWERPNNNICQYPSWGMTTAGQPTHGLAGCTESMYATPPPRGCGGLIAGFTHPFGYMAGTLPEGFKWLMSMTDFQIPGSKVSGTLPDLGLWGFMMNFDISGNRFSGTIPNYYLPSPCLQVLNIQGNDFEGTVPKSWNSYTVMMSLNLANNRFEGTIPDFGNMPELAELDLSGNRFSGTIPNDMWRQMPRLRWLRLHQNRFSGPVPPGLAWTGELKDTAGILYDGSQISTISVAGNPGMDKRIPPEIGTLALRVFNATEGMYCDDPKMLSYVPEATVCGGRQPGGGPKMAADPAPPTGPGA